MTEPITLASQVRIGEDVVFRDLGGEAVLLHLRTGVYFGLDPIGTMIWNLLEARRTLQEILDVLTGEYEVTEGQCRRDLVKFVGQLRERGLIEVAH